MAGKIPNHVMNQKTLVRWRLRTADCCMICRHSRTVPYGHSEECRHPKLKRSSWSPPCVEHTDICDKFQRDCDK